jgi:NADH-quinone oxidoreductase subunit L
LFLGAGVIIHYIHSNVIEDMGGLRKKLPVTHFTFLIACLAISGIPPFAGFFSKEEILLAAYHSNIIIFWAAVITSGLTAFYMFRLYFSVFYRKESSHVDHHHGEGSALMKIPLIILAAGAVLAGFIPFGEYISTDGAPLMTHIDVTFSILPVSLSVAGILLAAYFFRKESGRAASMAGRLGIFGKYARDRFYIDEIYLFITKKMVFNLIAVPAAWIDRNIVDGSINMLGRITEVFSESTSELQSGKLQSYNSWILGGALGIILLISYFFWFIVK